MHLRPIGTPQIVRYCGQPRRDGICTFLSPFLPESCHLFHCGQWSSSRSDGVGSVISAKPRVADAPKNGCNEQRWRRRNVRRISFLVNLTRLLACVLSSSIFYPALSSFSRGYLWFTRELMVCNGVPECVEYLKRMWSRLVVNVWCHCLVELFVSNSCSVA